MILKKICNLGARDIEKICCFEDGNGFVGLERAFEEMIGLREGKAVLVRTGGMRDGIIEGGEAVLEGILG